MTHETVTKMIRQGKSPLGLAFLFMTQIGLSYSQRVFYWENDYLAETSEENPEYRSIPVIEGEKVVVTCWVRATSNTEYRMTMYHDYHDASSSGMIEEVKDGVKYVKEVVNVNVVNSAAIDEQDIFCEINKPTEETISLLFKSFVIDDISVPDQEACEGKAKVTMKLRRPIKQRKEDDKFEKALKLKLKEQYGANEDEVEIDSKGIVTAKVNLNLLLNRDGVNKTKKVKDIESQCKQNDEISELKKKLSSSEKLQMDERMKMDNLLASTKEKVLKLTNINTSLEKSLAAKNEELEKAKTKLKQCQPRGRKLENRWDRHQRGKIELSAKFS